MTGWNNEWSLKIWQDEIMNESVILIELIK